MDTAKAIFNLFEISKLFFSSKEDIEAGLC